MEINIINSMKRQYGYSGILLAVLLLTTLAVGLGGCSGTASDKTKYTAENLFRDDRVATVRILMSDSSWENTRKNAIAENYVKADLWFDDLLVPDVAVRPKGNSSLMSVARSGTARMSLKVDINFFNAARDLGGVKKLNFNNGFSDPTLIREVLAYDLYRQMGIPTPRTAFVDLWVNDTHLGLYTMVEQVDKSFLAANFEDDTGNLYKPESPGAYLNWTEEDLTGNQQSTGDIDNSNINVGGGKLAEIEEALNQEEANTNMAQPGFPDLADGQPPERPDNLQDVPQNPQQFRDMRQPPGGLADGMRAMGRQRDLISSMSLKTNENGNDHSALLKFLEVLNKEPDETFQQEIEKVLDVDEVLRYLAVSTALVHLDHYTGQFGHNYYLYEEDGKFTIIPWDLNMSFGTFNSGLDKQQIINFYIDEPTAGPVDDRPLVSRLLAVPSYMDKYHGYLEELIEGPFSNEVMSNKIDSLAALIRPYVEKDELKFYSTQDFEKALGEDVATSTRMSGMGLNIGLKAFVNLRDESIEKQLDGVIASKSVDRTGNGGKMVGGGFPGLPNGQMRPGIPIGGN